MSTEMATLAWTEDEVRRASLYSLCGACHQPRDVWRAVWTDLASRQVKGRADLVCVNAECLPGMLRLGD